MKTILSFLLVAVCATTSFAQVIFLDQTPTVTPDLNRLDKQSDQRWEHEIKEYVKTSPVFRTNGSDPYVLLDKGRNLQTPAIETPTFTVMFTSQRTEFTPGDTNNKVKGHLVNHTDSTLHLVFHRSQTLPSDEWNSSVCFGDLCYIYFVDSLPWGFNEYYEFPPHAEADFKLIVIAPEGADDSLGAYIRIQAVNTKEGDSVGFFLVAKAKPLSSVGASNAKTNFKIESIYPSPLVSGSSLKVKVTSPDNAGYSYTIFDNLGREVAFGSTRHQLMIGENTVEISSLDGLLTGSYLLRIKFNGGGSDAIPFQVIR